MSIKEREPIVLGLSGKACTGKTSVAFRLAPASRVSYTHESVRDPIYWDAFAFASPLYDMAAVRQKITGLGADDRQLYELHRILLECFGGGPMGGAPEYDVLVDLVYEIAKCPCESEGTKPRRFLQYVGTDLLRAIDSDVWVKAMTHRIRRGYQEFLKDFPNEDERPYYGVAIHDLRFPNEADMVKSYHNGFLVRYTAEDHVRQERSLKRDDQLLSDEAMAHISELALDDYPVERFNLVLPTDDMTDPQEQAVYTVAGLKNELDI